MEISSRKRGDQFGVDNCNPRGTSHKITGGGGGGVRGVVGILKKKNLQGIRISINGRGPN